jgi:DNA-binding HxlR family transcriptional regulator
VSSHAPATRRYRQLCGIATALDVIGDRWAALVVRDLMLGPQRFGDLVEGLPGVGTNTLTARLKQLEGSGVVRRRVLPLPDRGTVYELTAYGRELEPILLALGRWGTKSMGRLSSDVASRSRWLVAAMLAFHDEDHRVARSTIWELRLTDGSFTIEADGTNMTASGGPPEHADLVVTTRDEHLHRLLTRQLSPDDAVASGVVTLEGEAAALPRLVELFSFPTLDELTAEPDPPAPSRRVD